eukprot:40830-Eustigmatos_ZCMA.PRE.1
MQEKEKTTNIELKRDGKTPAEANKMAKAAAHALLTTLRVSHYPTYTRFILHVAEADVVLWDSPTMLYSREWERSLASVTVFTASRMG